MRPSRVELTRAKRHTHFFAGPPVLVARQSVAVGMSQYRRDHFRIEPALLIERVFGIDREPLGQDFSGRIGPCCEFVELGPRRFGIDVIRRDRRHAAPVIDSGRDQFGQTTRIQVRRRLNIHGRAEYQPGHRNGPEHFLECGRLRGVMHFRAGFRHEILYDDFLDMSVDRCRSRIASRLSMRSSRVSPIPISIPVVSGTPASPAARIEASRVSGNLSGEPKCGPPGSQSRLAADSSMMPIEGETFRSVS